MEKEKFLASEIDYQDGVFKDGSEFRVVKYPNGEVKLIVEEQVRQKHPIKFEENGIRYLELETFNFPNE